MATHQGERANPAVKPEYSDDHSHGDAHAHSKHDPHDYRNASRRSLFAVLGLLTCHMLVEVIGGVLSGSLGLLAHATHMMTDVMAIGLALFAMWLAERPASISRTFGYHRMEVIAVLVNAVALCALAGWIFFEAYQGFKLHAEGHDHDVNGWILLGVAVVGLVINTASAWILFRSTRHSLNVEGAFWHIIADLMGTISVLISGAVLIIFDWELIDLILGLVLAGLIVFSASRLALRVFRILLESVPTGLDMYQLCSRMEDVEGVTLVHDVHAWTITTGYNAMAAHVLVDPQRDEDPEHLMHRLRGIVRDEFGIHHITLQMERSAVECTEHHHIDHLEARALSELD